MNIDNIIIAPLKLDLNDVQNLNEGTSIQWKDDFLMYRRIAHDRFIFDKIYTPSYDMRVLARTYNPLGILRHSVQGFGSVAVGSRERYDDAGNLLERINENLKFEIIKKDEIIKILEDEGLFNRNTGESIFTINPIETNGLFTEVIMKSISIIFYPRDNDNNPYWKVVIPTAMSRHWIETTYIVDGVTGEVQKSEERIIIEF